ncbi:hypothetical protein [Nocardia brasiliensis]|uniref:hypothetical protein n=1 Tax=Nocardia brasiliensis TaxID=37326 RepID=UPI002457A7FC|nr:hypothetical protein [Nocardia brasiliensis]
MSVPTRPGVYRDVRGDLWTFDGQTFTHIARWMAHGPMWPVRDHPGVPADRMAAPVDPGAEVLPLEWVPIGDVPDEITLP